MPSRFPPVSSRAWLFCLKLAVSAILGARGWLTMRWDSPLRSLVWNEDWWAEPLESIAGIQWEEVAMGSDEFLSRSFDAIGLLLIVFSLSIWVIRGKPLAVILILSTIILVLDSLGRWVASGYQWGMAIEHALQMVTPLTLLFYPRFKQKPDRWVWLILAASAMTFLGHGLYAAGVHPVPLSYQTMTMTLLSVSRETAIIFLAVAGWLDILAAVTIFISKARTITLIYMVVWGGLTALARVVSHFGLDEPLFGLDPWFAETLVRTPHWLLPLLALFLIRGASARLRTACD